MSYRAAALVLGAMEVGTVYSKELLNEVVELDSDNELNQGVDRLLSEGLIERVSEDTYTLTDAGVQVKNDHPDAIDRAKSPNRFFDFLENPPPRYQ